MMIFQVVEVFLEGQNWNLRAQGSWYILVLTPFKFVESFKHFKTLNSVIWIEDLATSHAKMGLAANFCLSLLAAGIFQQDRTWIKCSQFMLLSW